MAGIIERTWWSHLSDYALLPISALERKEGYVRVVTDFPSSFPNIVFETDLPAEGLEERIGEALAPFRERGLPLNWWIGPGTKPPELADRLREMGFEKSLVFKGMYRSLADLPRDLPSLDGVVFREVEDRNELAERVELLGRAYGLDPAACPLLLEMYDRLGYGPGKEWRHLAGYLGGRMVVAASVQLHPEAAVLHNVGAEPSLRRLGLATAATLVALELALSQGRETIVLQATGAGARLYRGLGFTECAELSAHTLAGPGGGGIWREPVPGEQGGAE